MNGAKSNGSSSQTLATTNSHQVMEFVNLFGTPKHNKEKARAVRSHVMKLVRKKQSESSSRAKSFPLLPLSKKTSTINQLGATTSISLQKTQSKAACDSTRLQPTLYPIKKCVEYTGTYGSLAWVDSSSRGQSPEPSVCAPRNWIPQGNSELSNISPQPFQPKLHEILLLAAQNNCPISIRKDLSNTYLSGYGGNPALLGIMMGWASEYIAQGTKSGVQESITYLELALKSISCTLADASIHGIENSTIAAIATLSNLENLDGDMEKALIHIRGLQALVAMKGGIDNLAMNSNLKHLVLWADLCNATRWQSIPIFQLSSPPILPSITQFIPATAQDLHLCLNDPIISTAVISGYSNLIPLLQDFHSIAMFLEFANLKHTSVLQDVAYLDHVYYAEHTNLMLMAQYRTISSSFFPVDINSEETFILPLLFQALMLYIYTNIRLTPIEASIRSILVDRIQVTVAKLPFAVLDVLFETFPHEVIWIMFLAGSSSVENTHRRYFIGHLKWMCKSLALMYWEEIKEKLRHFLWLHKHFLQRCKDLWTEISLYIPDDRLWNTSG